MRNVNSISNNQKFLKSSVFTSLVKTHLMMTKRPRKSRNMSWYLEMREKQKNVMLFRNEGPGGLALRNPIIMETISSFLDNKDLCQWYASSRIFKDIIEQMDDSTWRRRTQKLAKALNVEISSERTFREMFPIFKKEVDSLISRIHAPDPFNWINELNTLELFTAAARLAHYKQLGLDRLSLRFKNLSTIPGEYLCSLASSVRNTIRIQTIIGCDLVKIIDSLKCNKLIFWNQILDREATEAVLRAMDTRIEVAEIYDSNIYRFEENPENFEWMLDTKVLTKYNGKGRCRSIILQKGRYNQQHRQWLRDWAQDKDWSVGYDDWRGMEVHRHRNTETFNSNI